MKPLEVIMAGAVNKSNSRCRTKLLYIIYLNLVEHTLGLAKKAK